jgi:hypothetical protein
LISILKHSNAFGPDFDLATNLLSLKLCELFSEVGRNLILAFVEALDLLLKFFAIVKKEKFDGFDVFF